MNIENVKQEAQVNFCIVCSEINCTYGRCKDILQGIEEIKIDHTREELEDMLWP